MSLFCSISGQPPLHPVLSTKSGHVYEHTLISKYLKENDGRDPISGDALTEEDLVVIQTAPSTPAAPPRPPTFTSIPSLLHVLQGEWDATMLECLELRRAGAELRQELSHALYKEDAAMRVLARMIRERDEARDALASVKATLGPAYSAAGGAADVEMEAEAEVVENVGLPVAIKARMQEISSVLSAGRKKRKAAAGTSTAADIKAFVQTVAIPSLHGTKPPGVSALDIAHDAQILVTGGLDKAVQVYDRSTSKIVATLKGHTKKVTAVIASPTLTEENLPSFLISASLDKSVRVWSPNGNKTVYGATANLSTGGEVNGISLHPSGSLFASASSDGTWSVHDLESAKPTTLLTVSLSGDAIEGVGCTAIAFHPDGLIIAVGCSDSKIRIFNADTGNVAAEFSGHADVNGGAISSLAFSENGYTLASSAASSTQCKIWDLRKLSNIHSIQLAEGAVINALRFDYSSGFLAVVGTDLRVYANKSWEELLVNEENSAEITAVAFGTLSKEIAVSGMDRSVRFIGAPVSE